MNAMAKQVLSALFVKKPEGTIMTTPNNVHQFVERRNVDRRKANNPTLNLPQYSEAMTAIEAINKFGITRNQINSLLINQFHYPDQYRNTLDTYFVRHWEGSHFDKMIKDGTILQGDTSYLVVYQGCTPFTVKNAAQVKLSFRKPIASLGLQAYVLVKVLDTKDRNNNGSF